MLVYLLWKKLNQDMKILATVSNDNIKAAEKETDSVDITQQIPPQSAAVENTPSDIAGNTNDPSDYNRMVRI